MKGKKHWGRKNRSRDSTSSLGGLNDWRKGERKKNVVRKQRKRNASRMNEMTSDERVGIKKEETSGKGEKAHNK